MTMKKIFFTIFSFTILIPALGQKTEYIIAFNSGLFSFSGNTAASETFINYNPGISTYTNNPYGSKNGFCYGISANLKRINKNNLVLGLDLGYEILRSKITVNSVAGDYGIVNNNNSAIGKTFLNFGFVNINPQLGYRLINKHVSVDLLVGLDFAFCLTATEKGSATTTNGKKFTTTIDRKTIKSEIRPRFQVATNYKKMGAYVGYSLGMANYMYGYVGGKPECYARLIRFGLTYQIK
jgi:hypothetical protein